MSASPSLFQNYLDFIACLYLVWLSKIVRVLTMSLVARTTGYIELLS